MTSKMQVKKSKFARWGTLFLLTVSILVTSALKLDMHLNHPHDHLCKVTGKSLVSRGQAFDCASKLIINHVFFRVDNFINIWRNGSFIMFVELQSSRTNVTRELIHILTYPTLQKQICSVFSNVTCQCYHK